MTVLSDRLENPFCDFRLFVAGVQSTLITIHLGTWLIFLRPVFLSLRAGEKETWNSSYNSTGEVVLHSPSNKALALCCGVCAEWMEPSKPISLLSFCRPVSYTAHKLVEPEQGESWSYWDPANSNYEHCENVGDEVGEPMMEGSYRWKENLGRMEWLQRLQPPTTVPSSKSQVRRPELLSFI